MRFPKFVNMLMSGILIFPLLITLLPNNKVRLFIYLLLMINAVVILGVWLKTKYFKH